MEPDINGTVKEMLEEPEEVVTSKVALKHKLADILDGGDIGANVNMTVSADALEGVIGDIRKGLPLFKTPKIGKPVIDKALTLKKS